MLDILSLRDVYSADDTQSYFSKRLPDRTPAFKNEKLSDAKLSEDSDVFHLRFYGLHRFL
jgi:hypothetical protein